MSNLFFIKINELGLDISDSKNITISNVSSINNPENNSLMFIKEDKDLYFESIKNIKDSLILVPEKTKYLDNIEMNNIIYRVNSPREKFAKILNYILNQTNKNKDYKNHEKNIIIGENVKIDKTAFIEPFVFIDHNCIIGENCVIRSGARLGKNVELKKNTVIRQNAVVGGQGFGIERTLSGETIRIPHVGGVILGEHVEIGALTTVCSGTIDPTIIEDYVKIDDHVHVAHNCFIKKGTIITAASEISGSVTMGKSCWIGPNCSIMNGVSIGNRVTIGLGAVVTKSIKENEVVAGNPATSIEEIKKIRQIQKKLLMNS